jgi:hypothetical protein
MTTRGFPLNQGNDGGGVAFSDQEEESRGLTARIAEGQYFRNPL